MKTLKQRAVDLVRSWAHSESNSLLELTRMIESDLEEVKREALSEGAARAIAYERGRQENFARISSDDIERCLAETKFHMREFAISDERLGKLSARQRETCALMYSGKTYAEISELLGITQSTARNHVRGACLKLGCSTADSMMKAMKQSRQLF